VNLFALYLLYHGLVEALKAKPETTKVVMYVLVALLVLFFLLGLGTRKRASKFMDEFNNKDLKELLEDANK
jgi:multisubunit Na+/H+ antiporter MnhB subunit